VRIGDSGRGISRGYLVGNVRVAGISAGGLGVGGEAILWAVRGVTRLLLGDPAGSSPRAFCSDLGRLAAGVGARRATAPLLSGRRRT
jgi:hypothetical protein